MSYASCLENNLERADEYFSVALRTLEDRLKSKLHNRAITIPIVVMKSPRTVPVLNANEIAERVRKQRELHILCFHEMQPKNSSH